MAVSIDRRLPFVFTFAILIAAIIMIGRIRDSEFADNVAEADDTVTDGISD